MIHDVEVRSAGAKGLGLFARRPFAAGEFIFRRRHGLVVTSRERAALSERERSHLCQIGRDRFALVLPPGCYLNHACDPSAVRHGVEVIAWRAIAAGEEITLDYRLNALAGESWRCRCRSESCTGVVVGSFFEMEPDRQRAYLDQAPGYIRRETGGACGRRRASSAGVPAR